LRFVLPVSVSFRRVLQLPLTDEETGCYGFASVGVCR